MLTLLKNLRTIPIKERSCISVKNNQGSRISLVNNSNPQAVPNNFNIINQ